VICLSKSGKVYILPASKANLLSGPKPSESTWVPFWSSPCKISYTPLQLPEHIKTLASGTDHVILLSRSGNVFCLATSFEGNTFGQLGVKTSHPPELFTPYKLPSPSPDTVTQIAVGEHHSLILTSRGEVYSWGSNAQGQLLQPFAIDNFICPVPTVVPLQKLIPGLRTVKKIAAGGANSFLVADMANDVAVYASGSGMWGQLGSGLWNQIQHRPVRVKTFQDMAEWSEKFGRKENIGIRYITVGENHVVAVLDNDVSSGIGGRDVFIWGCGEAYQLGHGKVSPWSVWLTTAE
jgi:alpha-tubulin suppressor-like RCC1 family protein